MLPGMPSLGKSKKQGSDNLTVETNGTSNGLPLVSPKAAVDTPKAAKTPKAGKDESTGKQGFIAKITNRASLKKKTKSKAANGEAAAAPVSSALPISKSDEELRSAFKVYDSDSDGRISMAELRTVLTSLGGEISDEDLNQLMKQIDTDNDGFISVEEFVAFHRTSTVADGEISLAHDPMRDAFQMFDKDSDSRISASELQSVLVSLGDKGHSLEECKKMIQSVDKDGDGFVDFVEFQELMGGQ